MWFRFFLLAQLVYVNSAFSMTFDNISLFGGVAGGYTHIVPDTSEETSKNGYHLMIHGFTEIATSDWTFQLGGGFFYNRVYSDGEKSFEGSIPETVREQENLRIETRSGVAQLAARKKIGLGLEAGLLLRSLFGSSLSFSQEKDSKSAKFFLGPQLIMRLGERAGFAQRLALSLTTDINVPDREVYLLTAGFALGQAIAFDKEPVVTQVKEPIVPPTPPAPIETYQEIFADKAINFASASSQLKGASKNFVEELAAFLTANSNLWTGISIEGHTDKKGKLDYNMKLSQDRADAVRAAFLGEGIDASSVSAVGYGPTRPIKEGDSKEALAANRRVVMVFDVPSLEGRNQISAKILSLREKYFANE